MFVRTPASKTGNMTKSPTVTTTEEAGPSGIPKTQVRRSVEGFESRYRTPTPPKKDIIPAKTMTKGKEPTPKTNTVSTEGNKSPAKTNETTKYWNKTSEGKALLAKAKYHIGNSRNIKTEIKTVVVEVIEKMYKIIKELEGDQKGKDKGKQQPKEEDIDNKSKEKIEEVNTTLIKKIEEHSKLLQECKEETEKLREEFKNIQHEEKLSYASVAAKPSRTRPPIPMTLHSMAIASTNDQETGDEIIQKIRKTIDAKTEGIQIDRLRKAKDRKVIVGCRTREEIQRVKDRIRKTGEDLTVEEIVNKDPLVKLKDVLNYNTDEDILKAMITQNKHIFGVTELDESRMKIRYRIKTRNPHTSHVVVRVAPKLWQTLTAAGRVHIDLQNIRVEDQSPLIQCTRCLGYGHGKKYCKEELDKCSHCGGAHLRMECQKWKEGLEPTCCNCTKEDLVSVEHNAFSHECAVKKRWDRIARSMIAYC